MTSFHKKPKGSPANLPATLGISVLWGFSSTKYTLHIFITGDIADIIPLTRHAERMHGRLSAQPSRKAAGGVIPATGGQSLWISW